MPAAQSLLVRGVLCEVCNEDGSMARTPQLIEFCAEHGLVLTSIADLIEYIKELRGLEASGAAGAQTIG